MNRSDIERIAERLTQDGEEKIGAARDAFAAELEGRDYVVVTVGVPDARSHLGGDVEYVFERTLIAPAGTIEEVILRVAEICDHLDPGGRNLDAWDLTEPAAAADAGQPASAAGGAAAAEPDGADDADAKFEERLARVAPVDVTGSSVAPVALAVLVSGGDTLADIPILVLPEDLRGLCRDLRALAAKWMQRYSAAVTNERVG